MTKARRPHRCIHSSRYVDTAVTITRTSGHDSHLAWVRCRDAARSRLLDTATLHDLVDALEPAAAERALCFIRLELAGKRSCAGWDTSSFAALADASRETVAADLRASDEALRHHPTAAGTRRRRRPAV